MSAQPPQSPDGWYNEAFRRDQDYPDTVVIHGERTVRKMKELEVCVCCSRAFGAACMNPILCNCLVLYFV